MSINQLSDIAKDLLIKESETWKFYFILSKEGEIIWSSYPYQKFWIGVLTGLKIKVTKKLDVGELSYRFSFQPNRDLSFDKIEIFMKKNKKIICERAYNWAPSALNMFSQDSFELKWKIDINSRSK